MACLIPIQCGMAKKWARKGPQKFYSKSIESTQKKQLQRYFADTLEVIPKINIPLKFQLASQL